MSSHGDSMEFTFQPAREVYTVSSLNREARRVIEGELGVVWVEGEISGLARPGSGHLYWRMKDESAQLRCAMFRSQNRLLNFRPGDGQHVLARGRVSIYEPRGEYQLVVEYLEEVGEGLLRRRFEELKRKLAAEGLFDAERKREKPELPRRIGVVTSPSGAAVRDIVTVLARRFPAIPVLIYPTAVQGTGAAKDIASALKLADRRAECDLLILARGGGSLEDLWSFNEEAVARAMAAVSIPIISGVGHEIDFTIADFVADVRAPTPSGAAELAVPDQAQWFGALEASGQRLARAVGQRLAEPKTALAGLAHRLERSHPGVQLRQSQQRLDELETRIRLGFERVLQNRRSRLADSSLRLRGASPASRIGFLDERLRFVSDGLKRAARDALRRPRERLSLARRTLESVSPLATLQRGYAIVTGGETGAILTDARAAPPGAAIEIRLARGELSATVDESHPAVDGQESSRK
ncbi:MAG: exodeoxyribonuclease VII large subunit [Rhodospirillaceae bacterium]|nr:exodeoxyribonuclease VII large subunit [Rhodospirillaceae bacterium]